MRNTICQNRSEVINRVVKIQMHHLDGKTSDMKLYMPVETPCCDMQESAVRYLEALTEHLTARHLMITHYQIATGSLWDDGREIYSCFYNPVYIPFDKVYVPTYRFGNWVDPLDVKKEKQQQKFTIFRTDTMSAKLFLN